MMSVSAAVERTSNMLLDIDRIIVSETLHTLDRVRSPRLADAVPVERVAVDVNVKNIALKRTRMRIADVYLETVTALSKMTLTENVTVMNIVMCYYPTHTIVCQRHLAEETPQTSSLDVDSPQPLVSH